ncbi:response regulator transcription factor [Clostridium sp.]|uniref:response regulator transcription factor n=1 Tax=Clostridium sp. TaxID=1506 RepID=UPI003D6CC6E6
MLKKLLIIEDDIDLSNVMRDFLSNDGYQITQAFAGDKGLDMLQEIEPDLVILDIMLPGLDGIGVCKKIREERYIPIIIISAKNSDYDKVLALGVGADDYLTKPFSQIELVARVKSHIRRATNFVQASNAKSRTKIFGKLSIDNSSYVVAVDGKVIDFSPKEFQLLDFLSDHPSQVFTKDQLINEVWGYTEFIDDNTIAVYVGRIREKLAREHVEYIKTVWGVGYRWES